MPFLVALEGEALVGAGQTVNNAVQGHLDGVLSEVIGLLPTVMPVMISFLAIRKGISFVLSMLHSA